MIHFKKTITVLWLMASGALGLARGGTGDSPGVTPVISAIASPALPSNSPTPLLAQGSGSITVVPNPLGNEITFRALVAGPSLLKISIYDHFYAPVTVLHAKGNGCFDVLWKLKRVQDGIYYFESQIVDVKSKLVSKLPVQKVVVTK
jgi:hypothetical protein